VISPLGESFGHHIANLTAPQGGFLDAEEYTEKLLAPAPGVEVRLTHGPLVEGNLELYRASDNFLYALGLDYFEVPDGGLENIRIPEGATLRAEYLYHAGPAIGEGVFVGSTSASPGEAGSASESGRYATMLKLGRI
jgi:hypothetical protein